MNKLSKILIIFIIIESIILGVSVYYWRYYRNAYFTVANEMVKVVNSNSESNNK